MARSKRRSSAYNYPGLFDKLYSEPVDKEANIGNDIVAEGGTDDIIEEDGETELIKSVPESSNTILKYISFGSGSSGNCSYLGNDRYGILIDAGIDPKKVESDMERHGLDMYKVIGIVITHDHHDHVSHVYGFLKKYRHMAVFCTPRMLNGMLRRHGISSRIKDYHRPIYKEIPFNIKDFSLTAFEVNHDGSDNVGYYIQFQHHSFVVATDLGIIGERALFYMQQATAMMLESDYDLQMLVNGHYPEHLKARIRSERGHLSNKQVAEFLQQYWEAKLTHIFLCHLSKDNNSPQKALQSAAQALIAAGAGSVGNGSNDISNREAPVQLVALPRFDASPLFYIR